MSLAFLVTALVIVATPGTGAIYSMTAGLARGTRAGVLAAFASTVGTLPHLVAAVTGLAALLHASGVAYLLVMAWSTWRDRSSLTVDQESTPHGAWRVIGTGVTLNLLNPKLTIFFFAFLPQFVPAGSPHALPRMLALSWVFMLMTFVVFAAYAAAAAALRTHVVERPRVVRRIRQVFAASFAVLAGRLALTER